jgi:hypothetical protein
MVNGHFPGNFTSKIVFAFLFLTCAKYPTHLILLECNQSWSSYVVLYILSRVSVTSSTQLKWTGSEGHIETNDEILVFIILSLFKGQRPECRNKSWLFKYGCRLDWFFETMVVSCWSTCSKPVCAAVWETQHPYGTACLESVFTVSAQIYTFVLISLDQGSQTSQLAYHHM